MALLRLPALGEPLAISTLVRLALTVALKSAGVAMPSCGTANNASRLGPPAKPGIGSEAGGTTRWPVAPLVTSVGTASEVTGVVAPFWVWVSENVITG